MNPKHLAKNWLCLILERQVKQLRAKHQFKLVAVTGSVGKTSTKLAIATVVARNRRVLFQAGNYNDRLTVPLVVFGQSLPKLTDGLAWLRIIRQNRRLIKGDYPYDVVVVELGTDGPGQIKRFSYLKPDIAVVTAVAAEHMEFFKSVDSVAKEELTVAKFAKQTLINTNNVGSQYLTGLNFKSYGLTGTDYTIAQDGQPNLKDNGVAIKLASGRQLTSRLKMAGRQGLLVALAAAATADLLGQDAGSIEVSLSLIEPFAGRLRILSGLKNSTIIDDSYNASPTAVQAGLDVLYETTVSQRIAILGSMNELGDYSSEAHKLVGDYCDPTKLNLVVTIGAEAQKLLAPAAQAKGCQVSSFDDPYEAGRFVKQQLQDGAVILAEGSQNGVFAEEALKQLLANPEDANQLVRQSADWLAIKQRQFPKQ